MWHLFLHHRRAWTFAGVSWLFGTVMGETIKWFYPSRKEWNESRRLKVEKEIDAKVLRGLRTFGGPSSLHDSEGLAMDLGLDQDAIADSVERLDFQGKAGRVDGDSDHPSPFWTVVRR